MTKSKRPQLRRAIRLPHATAMVVGTIIGSAIFVQPSSVTSLVPSVTGILLVWLASGILTLFGALVCAELSSTFSQSGGVYIYLKEGFSPVFGFLWGWAMFWVMHSGIIAAVAGSDYPHQIGSIEKMLKSIEELNTSKEDKARILGGNTQRLLGF